MKQDSTMSSSPPPQCPSPSCPPPSPPVRLKGILRMLQPHYENESLTTYPYQEDVLLSTQSTFLTRRKKRRRHHHHIIPSPLADEEVEECRPLQNKSYNSSSSSSLSFVDLISLHKYVCFLIIQDDGLYQSEHVLQLRHRIGTGYHDCMTIFIVPLNTINTSSTSTTATYPSSSSTSTGLLLLEDQEGITSTSTTRTVTTTTTTTNTHPLSLLAQGTGFTVLPSSEMLRTVLNVTQVPTVVIVDTCTGRPISPNASLAMEWNTPHDVLQAWHRGQSGLTIVQLCLAVLTCQSQECIIL